MLTNYSFFLKAGKLVTFLFNLCYFMGIFWTVVCDILNDMYLEKQDDQEDYFEQTFEINDKPDS